MLDTEPKLNFTEPKFPKLDGFEIATISNDELAALQSWCERFYGPMFAPFIEWFGEVLANEQRRRTTGDDPKAIILPLGNNSKATASALVGSYLLLECAPSRIVRQLATRLLRHFTIAAYGELVTRD
jgi:hypothetical protein